MDEIAVMTQKMIKAAQQCPKELILGMPALLFSSIVIFVSNSITAIIFLIAGHVLRGEERGRKRGRPRSKRVAPAISKRTVPARGSKNNPKEAIRATGPIIDLNK
jgi:hypothetical protein